MFLHGVLALLFVLVQRTGGVTVGATHVDDKPGALIGLGTLDAAHVPHLGARGLRQHIRHRRHLSDKLDFQPLVARALTIQSHPAPHGTTSSQSTPSPPSTPSPRSASSSPGRATEPLSPHSGQHCQGTRCQNDHEASSSSGPAKDVDRGSVDPSHQELPPGRVNFMVHKVWPHPNKQPPLVDRWNRPYYYRQVTSTTSEEQLKREMDRFNNRGRQWSGATREVQQPAEEFKKKISENPQWEKPDHWEKIYPKKKGEQHLRPGENPWKIEDVRDNLLKQPYAFEAHEPGDGNSHYTRLETELKDKCIVVSCKPSRFKKPVR